MNDPSIFLRLPVLEDAERILSWENDPTNWTFSSTDSPYTLADIEALIHSFNSLSDIDQIRYLIIEKETQKVLGAADLFSIDRKESVCEVGILISNEEDRRKGVGSTALILLEDKAREVFGLSRLIALVELDNMPSIRLFEKIGYKKKGTRKLRLFPNAPYIQTQVFEKWLKDS